MKPRTKFLLDEAMKLSPNEREALAGEIFDSLEVDDYAAEAEWQAELEKRISDLDQGRVKAIPWNDARKMIFAECDEPARD